MTSSVDGSVRLWDIHTADKSQKTVIRPRCERGTKVSVSCATYLPNASVAAICHDGSLQLWGGSGPYHRPAAVVRLAHQPASTLVATSKTAGLKVPEAGTCIAAAPDSNLLLTRGTDHTMKVWDVRRLSSAVATHENLYNHYSTGACMFSPDGSLYVRLALLRALGGDSGAGT
jgi:WD40 repeat protein